MRLSLLVRADNTGLGVQTWELYRHLKPTNTYIIDITDINNQMGKQTKLHLDRFPGAKVIQGLPGEQQVLEILDNSDVVLTVEIPYNYALFGMAKQLGVKAVLQYNFEFLDYLNNPTLPMPDLFLAPSRWKLDVVRNMGFPVKFLPVPVNRQLLPFKLRTKAKHFLHIAGHKTYQDRNGTLAVIEAMKQVKSPIKLTIQTQADLGVKIDDPRIELRYEDVKNYWEVYKPEYDVLLLPRRYGGLSLQLNEALSVGMPVVMTKVMPQKTMLPKDSLIGVTGYLPIHTRTQIECYQPDVEDLAAKIDQLYNNPKLVKNLSQRSNEIAGIISWENQLPNYRKVLQDLCQP